MLIIATAISCKITEPGGKDISETAEAEDVSGASGKQQEEESENVEEEITAINLWISDLIPGYISTEVRNELSKVFDEIIIVDRKEDSDVWVEIDTSYKDSVVTWILVPVVSFFRNFDDISYEDIKEFWTGNNEVLNYMSIDGSETQLILTEEIYKVLEEILGNSVNENIKIVSTEELPLDIENNNSFSIIPFDSIEKKYKVLNLDNMSVFDKELDNASYPLALNISLKSNNPEFEGRIAEGFKGVKITNRKVEKLASVIMTGVTALARGKTIGRRMDEYGVLYPAEKIVDVLRNADITHISNEICFVEGCSSENKFPLLCSDPSYIELLRYVGTDVIELTGNHMNDYGPEWMMYTLEIYDNEGWPYFGGGRNLEDSYLPAIFEVNGNKIAFLGVNAYGLANANEWAREDSPGAARLNIWDEEEREKDFEKVENIIRILKEDGNIVIFTFQYQETESYNPTESQIRDFRRIIDAGADIVSGSQSHWPMGVEFAGDGFINYGLGNLFYNMRDILGLKQGIIAKHIFYDGKHINTILITTMLENLSQLRPTTPEERVELLNSIFATSIK
jgi:poly-gamma-glutamate synthesis protein (capsule biosynthesis protein)